MKTTKEPPKSYRDLEFHEVEKYAEKHSLNIETHENYREAAQALFAQMTTPQTKIFVIVRGGCVTAICCTDPNVDATLIDWDNNGSVDEDEINKMHDQDREDLEAEGKLHYLSF